MSEPKERAITWTQISLLIGAVAALAAAHAYFVVPRVVQEARAEWQKDDAALLNTVRAERGLGVDAINTRLTLMEARGIRLEDKIDRLIETRQK